MNRIMTMREAMRNHPHCHLGLAERHNQRNRYRRKFLPEEGEEGDVQFHMLLGRRRKLTRDKLLDTATLPSELSGNTGVAQYLNRRPELAQRCRY